MIKGMVISRKGFVLPLQKETIISLRPTAFTMRLNLMNQEKIEIELPINLLKKIIMNYVQLCL